jgi:membrane protease YdiL (CAAX protease family)
MDDMEIFYQTGFIVILFLLIIILHKWIGKYPDPLPVTKHFTNELIITLLLWSVAVVIPIVRIFLLGPWLRGFLQEDFLYELTYCPFVLLFYFLLPWIVVLRRHKWKLRDLGLTWRIRSVGSVVFALSFGILSGLLAYFTGQAVISDDPLSAATVLILLINNDFAEEFFHRGIILSKLERIFGQTKAIFAGGILFGLTHIAFDFTQLSDSGLIFVFFAFVLQTMLGWILGIIYIKTRSLWPGVALHFLVNWLPSILVGIFG